MWLGGLPLRRRPEGEELPARQLRAVQRCALLVVAALLPASLLESRALPLYAALAFPACAAGWYPTRKAVYREPWTFTEYLGCAARQSVAQLGFWVFLAITPLTLAAWGPPFGVRGALAAGALLLWNVGYGPLFGWLMLAKELGDSELPAGFAELHARARCPAPRVFRMRVPGGGRVASAFALPEGSRSRVLLSQTLFEELSPAELCAVHAHELAHLEHFDRPLRLRLTALALAFISVASFGVPLLQALTRPSPLLLAFLVSGVVSVGHLLLQAHHQPHELQSDLRAVELTGDPEAVASALIRIHTLLRLPRHFEPDLEVTLSHPSLGRRLAAIRSAAGAPAPDRPAQVLVGPRPGERVVFLKDRLRLLEGVPEATPATVEEVSAAATSAREWTHRDLKEASIHHAIGPPRLVLVTQRDEVFSIPLSPAQVSLVQEELAQADPRLRPRGARQLASVAGVLGAAGVFFLALFNGSFGAAAIALVATVAPRRLSLAAASGAAVGLGVTLALPASMGGGEVTSALAAVVAGALSVACALGARHSARRGPAAGATALLGALVPALGAAAEVMDSAADRAVALHVALSATGVPLVGLLALAGVLAAARPRVVRALGVLPALAAALALLLVQPPVVERLGADPFLAMPGAAPRIRDGRELQRMPVSPETYGLALGQDEQTVALRTLGPSGPQWLVGAQVVPSSDAITVERGGTVLAVADGGAVVRLEPVSGRREVLLPAAGGRLRMSRLSSDGARWSMTALETQAGRGRTAVVRATGSPDGPPSVVRFPLPEGQAALRLSAHSDVVALSPARGLLLSGLPFLLSGGGLELHRARGGPGAPPLRTALRASCEGEVCAVLRGGRTVAFRLRPAAPPRPLFTFPGELDRIVEGPGGALALWGDEGPVFVVTADDQVVRVGSCCTVEAVEVGHTRVAVLSSRGPTGEVTLYGLEP